MNMTWIDFYTKFAYKLLAFKHNRNELIKKIIKAFESVKVAVPTIEENNNEIIDLDPFTIYAFFNRQIKEETRKSIIKTFNHEFAVGSATPTDFIGIPVVNNMMTAFFAFKSKRKEHDIDNLWEMFETAINYSKDSSYKEQFIKWYDICQKQFGVKWNLTMAFFWINPEFYISLDSRNRWYMSRYEYFDEEFIEFMKEHHAGEKASHVPSGNEYIEVREKCLDYISKTNKYANLIELSHSAWFISEDVNDKIRESEKEKPLDERGIHTWIYSPGDNASHLDEFVKEGIFGIGWDGIDNPTQYESREDLRLALKEIYHDNKSHMNDSLCIWQFMHDIQIGDVIFAKKGRSEIVARGIVTSDYKYDETKKSYKNIREIDWTDVGSWPYPGTAALKTLTDITVYTENVNQLNALFDDNDGEEINESPTNLIIYTSKGFLDEVYMDKDTYIKITKLLANKKNIILQGAPGVGKSFVAKRLAYSIMGVKDMNRVEYIQFHQSYSYEDFIMGYRPNEKGFVLEYGSFYKFCKKAADDMDNKYFFIIDEINRGNLNKIFGELFLLLEADKRDDTKIKLLYSNELFTIPSNLYIIGLMNTADRSLAMMDYALRRRFAFYTIYPAFNNDTFKTYQHSLDSEDFNRLIETVKSLNIDIANDESLGKGFLIGHSYFSRLNKNIAIKESLRDIVEYELIPLLEEYWYDDKSKVMEWADKLRGSIK